MTPQTLEKKEADLKRFKPTVPWPEQIQLFADEDKVHLHLMAGRASGNGDASADASTVIEALTSMGVRNVDTAAVAAALANGDAGEMALVAVGQPPERGEDGRIEYKFGTEQNRDCGQLHLDEDDFGRVDFREVGAIEQVDEGQVLAEALDPAPGKAGQDIFGNEVGPQPGARVRLDLHVGRNVKLSEDGHVAAATAAGFVSVVSGKICVSSLYKIQGDVDFETGNIRFNGDVVVLGFVREDFRVEATGSVHVAKNVERATIIAGVNVEVKGGILGKESTEVVAGQDIVASYTNQAYLKAGQSISVCNEMVHTIARAPKVLAHSGRGAVLGGEIHASEYVNVRLVGDPNSGVRTLLDIEYDRELKKRIFAKEEEFDEIKTKLMEVKSAYDRMVELRKKQGGSLGKNAQENFERIIDELRSLAENAKTAKAEIGNLESQLTTADDLKIVVQDKMFHGTCLTILGRELKIVDGMQGGSFMLVNGEIKQVHKR